MIWTGHNVAKKLVFVGGVLLAAIPGRTYWNAPDLWGNSPYIFLMILGAIGGVIAFVASIEEDEAVVLGAMCSALIGAGAAAMLVWYGNAGRPLQFASGSGALEALVVFATGSVPGVTLWWLINKLTSGTWHRTE